MLELNKIYNQDCLVGMQDIPDKSIDCIITDLPYGTTACKWDSVIPFEKLWEQFNRLIKPTGAIVLFGQQPFTSSLIMSNIGMYKYSWIWLKDGGANFLNSHHQPLKVTEDICVFSLSVATGSKKKISMKYNPQMRTGFKPYSCCNGVQKKGTAIVRGKGKAQEGGTLTVSHGERVPINLLEFKRDKDKIHPTQKPVALIEYLINTYTNEGETVLDACMGSGTTAIAAINTKRNFIGFEFNSDFYELAIKRIEKRLSEPRLF